MLRRAIGKAVKGETPWPVFVFGPPGLGKTMAGLCLVDHVPTPPGAIFRAANGMSDQILDASKGQAFEDRDGQTATLTLSALWKRWECSGLAVLDDLASRGAVSDWHYRCVLSCLDRRLGKPLYVTSNLDLGGIARAYDDRIADRLAGGTVVSLAGESMRSWVK